MNVLVTGVGGQLGHDVMNELYKRGYQGTGSDIQPEYAGAQDGSPVTTMPYISLDITDQDAVMKVVQTLRPDVIVHCAAWTAVDLAEDDDKVAKVRAVNVGGTQNIADAAKAIDAKMVYLSTDYVFDGQGDTPWDPDFKGYKPLNVYGQTKLDGELAVSGTLDKYFIVRIAWVFGKNGKNYIKTMLNIGQNHDELRIVDDQIGTPTYTFDLASLLVDMIATEKYGYYHATNAEIPASEGGYLMDGTKSASPDAVYTKEGTKTGYISWYDFSREIFRQAALLGHDEARQGGLHSSSGLERCSVKISEGAWVLKPDVFMLSAGLTCRLHDVKKGSYELHGTDYSQSDTDRRPLHHSADCTRR